MEYKCTLYIKVISILIYIKLSSTLNIGGIPCPNLFFELISQVISPGIDFCRGLGSTRVLNLYWNLHRNVL